MIGENKLLSVISILGTALAICMIMVIVILYVVNTASFKPEVNRGRTCYITTVMSNGKDDNRRISYSSLGLLGLAMSYGAMLLLRDWLLATSLGKTGLSTGMFNGAVFIAAFLFCLVLNLFSAGLPAWRMSRLNITDSING